MQNGPEAGASKPRAGKQRCFFVRQGHWTVCPTGRLTLIGQFINYREKLHVNYGSLYDFSGR